MQQQADRIRTSVLAGMARDRVPGFSFTGFFLDTAWPRIGQGNASVTIPAAPQSTDLDGHLELTALLMTLDAALATPTRMFIQPGERIATTHLHAQFTGAALRGDLQVEAMFEGATAGDAAGQLLARGSAQAGGVPVCHGSASFVRLPPPPGGRVLAPLPWQDKNRVAPAPLSGQDLDARERSILAACDKALADQTHAEASFLRRFWGLLPQKDGDGAICHVVTGAHMANRVGHVQGGILLGLAAHTAMAAVPRHTILANLSAWFLSPGKGASLECRSTPIHTGRSFAVVKSEIIGPGGVRVMEAVTAHATPA
jgi:acyl-coenzyme A thioesterase PaaI-like protein